MHLKTCKKCGISKSLDRFHLHPQMKDGHLNQCRECRNEWMSQYRKQKCAQLGARAAEEKLRGSTPETRNARAIRRRRREQNQRCSCCRYRDIRRFAKSAALLGMEMDHVVPLSKGGINCLKNLQMLPRSLNRKKADKLEFQCAA